MDSEHAQLQHRGRQSRDSQQQTLQLVSSDHVTKAGYGEKTRNPTETVVWYWQIVYC